MSDILNGVAATIAGWAAKSEERRQEKEQKKIDRNTRVEKVTIDNPAESKQMQILASLYALKKLTETQFEALLYGETVEVELQGGWSECLVEPAFLVDDGEHILLEQRASDQQKDPASRILCTTTTPPKKVGGKNAVERYDRICGNEVLLCQIFSTRTKPKHRKNLVCEAMEMFYPKYKKFEDKSKPANQQPQQRSDEPELKNFKANGYRTVAGMLGVPVDEILSMKAKERAKFLEDMAIAAENFAIRSKYLTEKITMVAAQSTKDNDVWAAMIWHFKEVDPQKATDLAEMQHGGVNVKLAAKVCGINSDGDLAEIVADYHAWKQAKKDGKGKGKGKDKRQQRQQKTPPAGGTDPDSGSNKSYAGLMTEGFFAELIVSKGLAGVDTDVAQEILLEAKDKVPNFGNMGGDCPIQGIYAILLAYMLTGDIQKDVLESIITALLTK